MAESGKITREDIIAKDAFTSATEEAKQLLVVLNQITDALKAKTASTTSAIPIASPQTIEDVKKLTAQIDELKKQIAALESVKEKQNKATKEYTAAQAQENLARQKQRQEVTQQVKLSSDLTTAYEKQVVRLAQIKKELKELSVQGVKAPKALTDEFNKLDASVRKAEKSVGESQRNVGNYTDSVKKLLGVLGITAGISAVKSLITESVNLYRVQAKAVAQVEAGLKSTGGAVGLTIDQLKKEASRLQGQTLFGDEQILQESTAVLLTFTSIQGEAFKGAQQAALDLSTRLGGDLKGASIQLGKALNDPIQGVTALRRVGISFSDDQLKQIKNFQETNQLAKAQALILEELNKEVGGSAKAAADADGGFTQLANSFGDVKELIGGVIADGLKPLVVRLKETFETIDKGDILAFFNALKTGLKIISVGVVAWVSYKTAIFAANTATKVYELTTKGAAVVTGLFKNGITGATVAFKSLNATMKANPIGLVVSAITTLVTALYFFKDSAEDSKETNDELNKSMQKTVDLSRSYAEVLGLLDAKAGVANISLSELKAALAELEKQLEEYESKPIYILPIEDETPEDTAKRMEKFYKAGKAQILKDIDALNNAIAEKEEQIRKERMGLGIDSDKVELANRKRRAELIEKERERALELERLRYDEEYKAAKNNGEKLSLVDAIHAQNKLKINTEFNKKAEDAFEKAQAAAEAKRIADQDKQIADLGTGAKQKETILTNTAETQKELDKGVYETKVKLLEDEITLYKAFGRDATDLELQLAQLKRENAEKEKQDAKDLAKLKLNEERKVQQQVLQGIEQGVQRRSQIVQNGLNAEIKKQDEAIAKQQELASKGLENTLAYQEKKREELQAKLEREREAERKREEALQLAGAFLGSYQRRLDDKQKSPQALAGALADTLIAKAISSTIAGAFAEGVENFQGKGTGTSDSNLIAFSHGESVVTAKATQQYSGLVTAMNKGLVDDYVKQMILPDMDAPMVVNGSSFQSAAIVYTLTKELGELKQAIKNKQEIKVNWNAQGERVEEIVKDGMKTVIKHVTTGKRRL